MSKTAESYSILFLYFNQMVLWYFQSIQVYSNQALHAALILGFGNNYRVLTSVAVSGASGVAAILLSVGRKQPAAPAMGFPVEPAGIIVSPINQAPSCVVTSTITAVENSPPLVLSFLFGRA